MSIVSIYFFAGDFVDVLRRYDKGHEQIYQTHNEVARLIYDLIQADQQLTIYSFVTPEYRDERPLAGLRIVSLGAGNFATKSLLKTAVNHDRADAIVAFPNVELLNAIDAGTSRSLVVCANSYNSTGIRSTLARWRIVSLLNRPRFELVANHCWPATEHLEQIGVKREKLIAWDIAHPFDPKCYTPKALVPRQQRFEVIFVGSIAEGKGVSDLIRAIALLRSQGMEVHCSLAGLGDIGAMQELSANVAVLDLISFLGLIGNTEVFTRMAAADLVIVPSRVEYPEGFPLTMFEAIASRTPIVCSDHPMFRNLMIDSENASVFSAGDYHSCAAAIKRTLTNPNLYNALSENASSTWEKLKGPADWRTLIFKWVVEGRSSQWITDRMLSKRDATLEGPN
jgi:glycosyltransferase involved in cell wall biosynthesis